MRFKELRTERNMTQDELRKAFNAKTGRAYTVPAISLIESGSRTPEIPALCDFADFFGVTLDYLLGRSEIRADPFITPDEAALLEAYRAADKRGRDTITAMAEYEKSRHS